MPRTRAALATSVVSLALILPISLTTATSVAAPVAGDPTPAKAAPSTSSKAALQALTRVERLADGTAATGPGKLDATGSLRLLDQQRAALTGAARESADGYFKRPTSSTGDGLLSYGSTPEADPLCDDDLCVHYVTSGKNKVKDTDNDGNGYPDYVDTTLAVLQHVHDTYIEAGYREPKPDGTKGGSAKIDIYLGQLGDRGLYGYCTTDEPNTQANKNRFDRWSYCALDNDFSAGEFGTANTPLENLEVTAAHEYFHATQAAYDYFEDLWLSEATAAWVEDEMYDDVNDNLQYLPSSQMRKPGTSLDTWDQSTGFHYGTWSFFRFLTEKYPTKKGALPRLVLDIWKLADGSPTGKDQYSWQAVDSVLRKKHTSGAAQLADYAAANRRPGTSYDEGKANHYPTAPLQGSVSLGGKATATNTASVKLDHLTTATYRIAPKGTSKSTKLKVIVDMAPKARGSLAIITSLLANGKTTTTKITLDGAGNGTAVVPFGSSAVRYTETTLVNGSGRFNCFSAGLKYSCQGTPLDQNQVERISARLVR